MGIFVGLDGRLFACPYSSKVTQIPSFHSKRPNVSFQSAPIWSFDQILNFHSPHDSHCDISKKKSYYSSSLSRRLVVKKSISSNSVGTQTFHYSANHIFWTDHQSRKSDLIPTQMFTFIGMEFLTHMNIVRVPQARVQILLETVKKFSQKTYVSAREFLPLLGQLNAAADFVMLGRLHLRPLQMSLLAQWRPRTLPLQHQIKLTADVLHHLNWWKQHQLYLQGVPMKADPPSHHIFSDASLTGRGSHLEPEGLLYHGVWSKTQSRLHINILEMMAISLTLRRALQFIKNSTVLISTDNTTVVAYLNRQGGTHSPDLCMEVWKTVIWCHQNQINLLIKHIPGKFNVLADLLSRITKPISTEWGLNQSVANTVFRMTQFPNLDLFATRLNHKLPLYVSPIPDQKALSIDALTMNWNHIHGYAFPPFHLIPSVINKIRTAQCKVVLIAPFWPNRTWFPELLNLLISSPITLPIRPNLLEQLHGKFLHQNPGLLQLHTWELSNNPSEIKKFQ